MPGSADSASSIRLGYRPRLLIVEDELFQAMDLGYLLGEAGFDVVGPAQNLRQADALAELSDLDGAVLDIVLGKEYVWPLAMRLLFQRVPFGFISGFVCRDDFPPALRHAPLLAKPASNEAIIAFAHSVVACDASIAFVEGGVREPFRL